MNNDDKLKATHALDQIAAHAEHQQTSGVVLSMDEAIHLCTFARIGLLHCVANGLTSASDDTADEAGRRLSVLKFPKVSSDDPKDVATSMSVTMGAMLLSPRLEWFIAVDRPEESK